MGVVLVVLNSTQLFAQLVNWFMFFCITRTLSNTLETVLTLMSLYYWPCMSASSSKYPLASRSWGLALAALACAIRPTSAITWVYVGLLELFLTRHRVKFIFFEVLPIGYVLLQPFFWYNLFNTIHVWFSKWHRQLKLSRQENVHLEIFLSCCLHKVFVASNGQSRGLMRKSPWKVSRISARLYGVKVWSRIESSWSIHDRFWTKFYQGMLNYDGWLVENPGWPRNDKNSLSWKICTK